MADVMIYTPTVPPTVETEGRQSLGIGGVAKQICSAFESYAAAATDARLLLLTGYSANEGTRRHRLYQQSYRPGAWGDPL
jgi:hypothetical protein